MQSVSQVHFEQRRVILRNFSGCGLMFVLIFCGMYQAKRNILDVQAAQDCGDSLQTSASVLKPLAPAEDLRPSFDGTHLLYSAPGKQGAAWQVWERTADGSEARQITHCAADCMQAEYLPGDQIVYTAKNTGGAWGASSIFVSRLDGSDAHPITFGPGNFQVLRVLHNGRILLAANAPLTMTGKTKAQRALYQIRPDGSGLYRLPQPVAQRYAQDAQPSTSTTSVGLLPSPAVTHAAPLLYPSILHLELKTGRMLCLNATQTMDTASGRLAGSIAQVRVLALERDGNERTLGSVPVEQDGSFYMTVPADKPVRFELLNKQGAVVHEQKSWIWTRPGEDRGCAGCHENPAVAPENHWPLALKRLDTPMLVGATTALTQKDGKE